MEPGPSPLELLHPDGIARRITVIGDGCPEALRPRRPEQAAGEPADLVILAPSQADLRDRRWAESAAEAAAGILAADGVVYVLSSPRPRRRIVRQLAERNIDCKLSLVHDPSRDSPRCLVPLTPEVATYAFTNLIATRPGRRRVVLRALRVGWLARVLGRTLPAIGVAATAPGSRPLFGWLFVTKEVRLPLAVVTVSWRGSEGALVAHGFEDGATHPSVVAKVCAPGRRGPNEEAAVLRRLGPEARAAGAAVPEPLLVEIDNERAVVFETSLVGRAAAALLGESPALAPSVTMRLTEWLENWNLDTRSEQVLSAEWLESAVGPARRLAPLLPEGDRYLEWLDGRCRSLAGATAPLVATHNDLTMVNVFVAPTGALGVVDWEAAREQDLPLVDFYYAAADAAAAAKRYVDRPAAFRTLFGAEAGKASLVRQLESRLVRALDLNPALAELAFHACWIRHATAEQGVGAQPEKRPFLEILRAVAGAAR